MFNCFIFDELKYKNENTKADRYSKHKLVCVIHFSWRIQQIQMFLGVSGHVNKKKQTLLVLFSERFNFCL